MDPTAPATPEPDVEVLPTHTPALFAAAVRRATELLTAGEAVALPTETVYGLAANALDPQAVRRIFAIKGRPAHNPVIVHVASGAMARSCAREWPDAATRLATAFWPGPLTLVLPRASIIPDAVTAGGETVGIRWPSHPFIQAVIRACGFPLAAPSANRSNEISPTHPAHVLASLGNRVRVIVDGGASQVGIESTVIDLAGPAARLLRPGMIHEESLRAVVELATAPGAVAHAGPGALRSPGQLRRHYAPRARLLNLRWHSDQELLDGMAAAGVERHTAHVLAYQSIPSTDVAARVCVIPQDPEAYARAMYAEWHHCDELGARWIVVETPPDLPAWQAIKDRLRRASATEG